MKDDNADDYAEVNEIRDRHHTLDSTSRSLDIKLQQITKMLDDKKNEVYSYERFMDTEIMRLGNDIASLTTKCDAVEAEKSSLQSSEEDGHAKKLALQNELSQVIFAIEMIEGICSTKTKFHTTNLPYAKDPVTHGKFDYFSRCEDTCLK